MRSSAFVVALALALATPAAPAEIAKPKRPRLDLRASPRVAFSPVNVLLTAELQGGDELAEFHCPEIEWDWDDGGRSAHEADCEPLESGGIFERRYTAQHAYRTAGTYNVRVTMRRGTRAVAVASTTVTVRPGARDIMASE